MPSIGDIIDRLYRDYLTPPDEQPAQAPLAADLGESDLILYLETGHLSTAELDAIGVGTVLELEQELFRVLTINTYETPVPVTVGYRGGVLGTQRAAHQAGGMVIVRPNPTRKTVFDAVGDSVVALWPTLARVKSAPYSTGTGSFIEVADDVEEVLDFRYAAYEAGSSIMRYDETSVELLPYPFDPATTTLRAIQLDVRTPSSRTGYLRYLTRFERPWAEHLTFESLGLREEWAALILYGALLRVLAPSDLSARQVRYITESLQVQGFPVGSGRTLAQTLVQIYEYLLGQARHAFQAEQPIRQDWAVI